MARDGLQRGEGRNDGRGEIETGDVRGEGRRESSSLLTFSVIRAQFAV